MRWAVPPPFPQGAGCIAGCIVGCEGSRLMQTDLQFGRFLLCVGQFVDEACLERLHDELGLFQLFLLQVHWSLKPKRNELNQRQGRKGRDEKRRQDEQEARTCPSLHTDTDTDTHTCPLPLPTHTDTHSPLLPAVFVFLYAAPAGSRHRRECFAPQS